MTMFAVRLVCGVHLLSFCLSAPHSINNEEDISVALHFMKKYGYMSTDDGVNNLESFSDKIKSVQRMGAIEETGVLDEATKKLMSESRCGNPDLENHKRNKRYALTYGFGWEKRKLTFYLENWSQYLGEHVVAANIHKALNAWGKHGRLTFKRSQDSNADIVVKFVSRNHGDRWPFDGPGTILAHAFAPNGDTTGGDIHFDADERWVNKGPHETLETREFNFYPVALHELGHSMGLSHSKDPSAVMFAYYRGATELTHDDVLGMWALYINRTLEGDTETHQVPPVVRTPKLEIPRWQPHYVTKKPGNENRRMKERRPYVRATVPTFRPSTESELPRWHPHYVTRKCWNENRRIKERRPYVRATVPTLRPFTESELPRWYPHYVTKKPWNGNRKMQEIRPYIRAIVPTLRPSTESGLPSFRWYPNYITEKPQTKSRRTLGYMDIYKPGSDVRRNFYDRFNDKRKSFTKPYGKDNHQRYNSPTSDNKNIISRGHKNTGAVAVTKSFYRPGNKIETNTTDSKSICDGDIDAVTMWKGKLFVFKGEYVWSFEKQKQLVKGYPLKLLDMFTALPKTVKKIDAAYETPDNKILVLFSGRRLWEYDGTGFLYNNPKNLAQYGLPTYLTKVDAVLSFSFNDTDTQTWFFNENKFWIYNEAWKSLEHLLPQSTETLQNVPPYLDAATVGFNGKIVFFKGKLFWEYDGATANSPVNFSEKWFGCPNLLSGVCSKSNSLLLLTFAHILLHIYELVIK